MSGKAKSLADQAYETIKQNILNLTYPPGMPLTEVKLAEELGMSRSPVPRFACCRQMDLL